MVVLNVNTQRQRERDGVVEAMYQREDKCVAECATETRESLGRCSL